MRSQQGYILLVLLLMMAVLSIGALEIARSQREYFVQQIKRDREEEMIHRGVQYARAVKKFYKKFGRYPGRIEDLENTNNYRSLRKRYKDPLNRDKATGKELDFKFLHMTDIQSQFNPGAASMLPPGPDANLSADNPGVGTNGGVASALADQTSQQTAQITSESQPVQGGPGAQPGPAQPGVVVQNGPGSPLGASASPNQQVFGGAAIVGVASASKAATIREFNKKNHYNQWQFIYDPSSDRGGLLMTPNQPPLQGAVPVNQMNGQQAQSGPGVMQNGPGAQPQQPPQNQDNGIQQ